MAANDPVVEIIEVLGVGADQALPIARAGGSTPAESVNVWALNDTIAQYLDIKCALRGYGGGGLTLTLPWMAASATSGAVQWEIAIRRWADDAEDIDAAHTYLFNTVSDTTASAAGELSYPTITFTDGADMDSWADGEVAIVRVRRNPAGTDTMTGDAQLVAILGKETA